jgi:hypothetical protein
MGTFSAAGYTPPEKKKKIKEDANLDKVNAVASDLKKMSQQPIKPMGQSNTSGSNLPNVNAPGAPDMFKEKKKVKEEVEQIDEKEVIFTGSPKHTAKKAEEHKKMGYKVVSMKKHKSGIFGDNSEKHTYKMAKEEFEQVDEVLTKKEPASTWIRDFIKSKDPKFAGKSKKERQRMALGAYYAKQRNEEVEIDEASEDKHFAKQSQKMQDAINMHLRKGKTYKDAVASAKKHVKESLAMPLLGDMDDESAEMAKAQLKALAAKANALADQLSDDLMIEPWVQSKIAVAKDYVTSVHDYMIYGEHDKNNEQTGPDTPMTFPGMSVDVNTGHNV